MNIYKVNDNYFILKTISGKQVEGNKDQIIAAMLLLGVQSEEIELGLSELANGANYADYGIGLTFGGPKFIYAIKLAS